MGRGFPVSFSMGCSPPLVGTETSAPDSAATNVDGSAHRRFFALSLHGSCRRVGINAWAFGRLGMALVSTGAVLWNLPAIFLHGGRGLFLSEHDGLLVAGKRRGDQQRGGQLHPAAQIVSAGRALLANGLLSVLPVGFAAWYPCRVLLGIDDAGSLWRRRYAPAP